MVEVTDDVEIGAEPSAHIAHIQKLFDIRCGSGDGELVQFDIQIVGVVLNGIQQLDIQVSTVVELEV